MATTFLWTKLCLQRVIFVDVFALTLHLEERSCVNVVRTNVEKEGLNKKDVPVQPEAPVAIPDASLKDENLKQLSKKELLKLAKTNMQAQLANCKLNAFHAAISRLVKRAEEEGKVKYITYINP